MPQRVLQALRGPVVAAFAGTGGLKLFYLVAQFAIGLLLARLLGVEALGRYALAMAAIQLASVVGQFGFPASLVRTIVASEQQGGRAAAVAEAGAAIRATLGLSLLAGGVMALANQLPGLHLLPDMTVGIALVVATAVLTVMSAALRGAGRIVRGQLPDQLLRPVLLLALIVALAAAGRLGVETALAANLVATLAAVIYAGVLLSRWAGEERTAVSRRRSLWSAVVPSAPYFLLAAAQMLNYQLAILIAGALLPDADVGQLRLAMQLNDGLAILLIALSTALAPMLAAAHVAGDRARLVALLVRGQRAAAAMMVAAVVIVFVVSEWLVVRLFGADFAPAAGLFFLLAVGQMVSAPFCLSGVAANMTGQPGLAVRATLVSIVLLALGGTLATKAFGLAGLAVAVAATLVAVNLLQALALGRATGQGVTAFHRAEPLHG